jgi:hypothetical protein
MTLSPLKLAVEDYRRIDYDCVEYDPDPNNLPADAWPKQEEGEDDDQYNNRMCEWEREYRRVVLPEPGTFEPPSYIPTDPRDLVDLRKDYEGKPLQIIVKLANIHLTPQKPEYKGGKWHVEGQMVSELISVPTTFIFISNMSIRRTNIYVQRLYTITTARISPTAALHSANNRIRTTRNLSATRKARTTGWKRFSGVPKATPRCK